VIYSGGSEAAFKEKFAIEQANLQAALKEGADKYGAVGKWQVKTKQQRKKQGTDTDAIPVIPMTVRHRDVKVAHEHQTYRVLDLHKLSLMQDAATTARLPAALLDELVCCTVEIQVQGKMVPVVVYDEDVKFPERAVNRAVRELGLLLGKEDLERATRVLRQQIEATLEAERNRLNPPQDVSFDGPTPIGTRQLCFTRHTLAWAVRFGLRRFQLSSGGIGQAASSCSY